ncbi:hypothetical protein NDU88_008348 [Pleurodeles waltl]|uniref:Uncharacterized protein n=1 Tax=Pleurodeles waltl TaxID=8319 RepID=A0AAV7NVR3_PLEWA|nr:hypothetical protein NDU88_008348 [Pleurodeles waltl]
MAACRCMCVLEVCRLGGMAGGSVNAEIAVQFIIALVRIHLGKVVYTHPWTVASMFRGVGDLITATQSILEQMAW